VSGVRTSTGLFIVFEGGDGVGKSTQVELLCAGLAERGIPCVKTYEPGDSVPGRRIRHILLDPATGDLAPRAEALLYAADKAHHVTSVVLPALKAGAVVVCDRYVDSMLAYQGAGRVLDPDEVERVARWATADLRPHLTVLLDIHPDQALTGIEQKDRLEAAGADVHERAREEFLILAARDPAHYLVLGAREDRAVIAERVLARVSGLLAERDLSEQAGTLSP